MVNVNYRKHLISTYPEMETLLLKCSDFHQILNFAKLYTEDPKKYENWSTMEYTNLHDEVCNIWGISTWTASILAIFYFANENVFPYQDGTIKKALKLLEQRDIKIDPERSSPYKTYLAISLWKLVDEKLI